MLNTSLKLYHYAVVFTLHWRYGTKIWGVFCIYVTFLLNNAMCEV